MMKQKRAHDSQKIYLKAKSKVMHQHMYTQIQRCQYKIDLETISSNSI